MLRRDCLPKRVIEGKIERSIVVIGRRGRRRKKLMYDVQEKRCFWKLKEETLDLTLRKLALEEAMDPS